MENQSISVEKNLDYKRVHELVDSVFGEEMHKKRVTSLANAAFGLMQAEELFLHKMGKGWPVDAA